MGKQVVYTFSSTFITLTVAHLCGGRNKSNYVAFESTWREYESLVISSSMVWEHLPDRYVDELYEAVNAMNTHEQ